MDVMRINNEIYQAVTKYFTVEEFNQSALGFIQYKLEEGTPFGHLTVLHYFMFGGKSCEIYRVSAAIELMILSLDILDDLQDQDDFSKPWTQMDSSLSLNVATGFLLLSNEILLQTSFEMNKKLKVLEYFNSHIIQAVNGQHVDLLNSMTSEQEYIQMVKLKSGALVAAACTVGTVLATEDHHHIVKEYAEYIGIAAQIKNDMKDFLEKVDWRDVMHKKKRYLFYLRFKVTNQLFKFFGIIMKGSAVMKCYLQKESS